MLKPTPSLPPPLEAIELLMPMTSPFMLTSGPPELPGLIAASVWRKSWFSTSCELVHVPAPGADDPLADRVGQAERAAQGQDPGADRRVVAVAEPGGGQVVAAELQHGDVGLGVGPDPLGRMQPGRRAGRCWISAGEAPSTTWLIRQDVEARRARPAGRSRPSRSPRTAGPRPSPRPARLPGDDVDHRGRDGLGDQLEGPVDVLGTARTAGPVSS